MFHPTSAHRVSVFRAFPARPAVAPLGARCSPVVWLARVLRPSPLQRGTHPDLSTEASRHPGRLPGDSVSGERHQRRRPMNESPDGVTSGRLPLTERERRALPQAPLDSASGRSEAHRSRRRASTSERCSDRASVPPSPPLGVERGRCSPDLSPLRGLPTRPLGRSPPLPRFRSTGPTRSEERARPASRGAPGSRISRAWRRLRRAATAPMRSLTSSDSAPPSTPLQRTEAACPAYPPRRTNRQRTECHRL